MYVLYGAKDTDGNVSAWGQSDVSAGGTSRIDRTAQSSPTVSGGSLSWQSTAAVTVTAAGAADSPGSGVASYQYRTSTDGGVTWGPPLTGNPAVISAQGETLVQFRAVDGAGFTSAWAPSVPDSGDTVRIDRTLPTAPTVTGGSLSWQNAASVTVSAAGSTDSGGSGLTGYEQRTSTDGGATWTAPAAGSSYTTSAEGETLVELRSVDGAGSTVRIDRTAPAAPTVSGGSTTWQNVASVTVSASGSTDTGGSGFAGIEQRTSLDNGLTWSAPSAGSSLTVGAEGQTLVQFRTTDNAGNTSAWTPASSGATNTIRIDRTVPTDPASFSGGSLAWQTAASVAVTASGAADSPGSGIASYQYRTSTDGGTTWGAVQPGATATVSAQGETVVQFRATDAAGYTSNWAPAAPTPATTVRLDRTAPTAPTLNGGSLSWQNVASVDVSASGSTDANAGFAGYQYRTSTDGGTTWSAPVTGGSATITAQGETLLQFRAVDASGTPSNWVPTAPTAGSTVRQDRTAPTAPTVTGGSSSWQSAPSVTITGGGSSDAGGSGLDHYEFRTSTSNGSSWSSGAVGNGTTVTAEGATLVQVRSVDLAGNASAWTPGTAGAANTAKLDRTAPAAPTTLTGGSLTWTSTASVTVTASGATDTSGSGLAGYEYETSTDGGTTWSSPVGGTSVAITAQGETVLRFRSVDNAGNRSSW